MKPDIPTDRLMRLLIADFRYKEAVDESIWLDHARPGNGRVIFYPDGLVSSIEHSEFSYIEPDDSARFDEFMRFIKPASPKERFLDWADPVITMGCALVALAVLSAIVWGLMKLAGWTWHSIAG